MNPPIYTLRVKLSNLPDKVIRTSIPYLYIEGIIRRGLHYSMDNGVEIIIAPCQILSFHIESL